MTTIAIINLKGGVGKSVTAINVAYNAAMDGAALRLNRSSATVREWHRQFIRTVAENFGLL